MRVAFLGTGRMGFWSAVKIVRNMAHGIATAGIGECLRLAVEEGTRQMPVSAAALDQAHAAQAAGRGFEDYAALADYVEG